MRVPVAIPSEIERFFAMGTRVELHRFGAGDVAALAMARRAIEAVDDALTIHRPSATTALNETLLAGREATITDPVLFDALVEIEAAHKLTFGLFDPAADTRTGPVGWGGIAFDKARARIAARQPVAFDFGGFGKGFALDRACAAMRRGGVGSAMLSAGESSIAVIGEHPLGGAWPIAIPDPLRPDQILVELELMDESLSISSTVGPGTDAPERTAMIRPGDGAVIGDARCAVVLADQGSRAEVISTALIVADHDQAERLIGGAPARRFLFDLVAVLPLEAIMA